MKNKIPIPDSVYEGLAARFLQEMNSTVPVDPDDGSIEVEYYHSLEDSEFFIQVRLDFEILEEDNSFTHEFGIERVIDYSLGKVEDYWVYNVMYYDEILDKLYDIYDEFDIKRLIEIIDTSS